MADTIITNVPRKEKVESKFVMPDGRCITPDFGKFRSRLIWIFLDGEVDTMVPDTNDPKWNFLRGIDARSFQVFPGIFGKTKKGKNAFYFSTFEHSPHILVCASWGGAFERSRGHVEEWVERKAIYNHRASSNGGGVGNTWLVFDVNDLPKLTLDDF